MSNELKIKNLKVFLRFFGVMIILVFSLLFVAFVFKLSDFNPGGPFIG